MEGHPILRSLLTTVSDAATTTTAITGVRTVTSVPQKSGYPKALTSLYIIILRLVLILFVGIVAIWANREASKGFAITVVNDAGRYTLTGKRFSLFFESDDKATRVMLNTSRFVENLLYPSTDRELRHIIKKQIDSVTLRLAPGKLPADVAVDLLKPHEYLISLSPAIMETSKFDEAVVLAVLRGMARVWLWDGKGTTPPVLLNGVVEYISNLAGFTAGTEAWKSGGGATTNEVCWKDDDARKVAGFLRYCDETTSLQGGGGQVIRRLNAGMMKTWHDGMMDDALGMPSQHACASYNMMMEHHHSSSSSI